MDDHTRTDEGDVLRVRLDLQLDRRPIRGRLRTEQGADERFVGWLGFVDALQRVQAHRAPSAGRHAPRDAATADRRELT